MTLCVIADERASEGAKGLAVYAGLLLLVFIIGAAWVGAAWPLLRMMGA